MVSSEYSPLATQDPEEQAGFTLPPNRVVRQRQGRPSHGSVVILHVAFKLVALLLYLLTLHSFITTFILVTLLLSADFWVVKNICGRLLAGLRWWSIVDEEGELQWKYESWSSEERAMARQGETTFFWVVLAVAQFLWLLLATIALFTFKLRWLLLCSLALCLNTSNLAGCARARFVSESNSAGLRERAGKWLISILKPTSSLATSNGSSSQQQ